MPALRASAQWLNRQIKDRVGLKDSGGESGAGRGGSAADAARSVEKLIQPSPQETREHNDGGYDNKQRRELDRLIQSSPGPSDQ
jgi:hypothetical protein